MGLELGLEQAGFEAAFCVEKNACAHKTITDNKPGITVWDDVCTLSGNVASRYCPDPILVSGGPPCQSFSSAGKRKAFSDQRGVLVFEFARLINEIRPRFFLMENVKGLTTARDGDGPLGSALDTILRTFSEIGYKTVHGVVDAVDYGVPQFRERLVILGSRDNEALFLPLPTHFKRHQNPNYRWQTLGSAIADLQGPLGPCARFSPAREKWMPLVPPGGNWNSLSEENAKNAMGNAFFSGGGKTGYFRRLSYDQPCPTLVTSPTQKSTLLCHPMENRPLSVREYCRIQQFPDNWKMDGKTSDLYVQLGNAVPVGLGKALGQVFSSVAKGDATVYSKRK